MGKAFYNAEDKRQKLNNSVCLYKNKPYWVTAGADRGDLVTLETLAGRAAPIEVRYTDADFDYKSVPLGYINYGINALYLSRNPARQYKQGLSIDNITVIGNGEYAGDFIRTKSMENCILAEHPSYAKALEAVVEGEARGRAFSRHCALISEGRRVALFYRGRLVGHKQIDGDAYVLLPTPEYSYLRGILNKNGVMVC